MMNLAGRDSASGLRFEQFKNTVESPPAYVYLWFFSSSVLEIEKALH